MRSKIVSLVAVTLILLPAATAVADRAFTANDIEGRYAFSFQGEIIGVGVVAATGMIKADGRGNITEGMRIMSVNGVSITETFTCTLSVNPNGTGSAECPLDHPVPGFPPVETFGFVLEENVKSFRYVGTTPGVVVLGSGRKQ